MDSIFLITLLVILFTSVLIAIIRRNRVDVCLKAFKKDCITINIAEETYSGIFHPAVTGLALEFSEPDAENRLSRLIYKSEYPNITGFIRKAENLSSAEQERRTKLIAKLNKTAGKRHLRRRITNFIKIIRDSVIDVFNLFIGQMTKKYAFAASISGNAKYLDRMNSELVNSINSSYELVLERYIGRRVLLNNTTDEFLYEGILKDYTADFILLLDVHLTADAGNTVVADIIVPRSMAMVRSLVK